MLAMFAGNFAAYLGNGTLARLLKAAYPTFVCAIYPSSLVILLVLAAVIAAWLGATVTALFAPAAVAVSVAIGLFAIFVARGLELLDRFFKIYWLNRIYSFNRQQAKRRVAGLEERINQFASILAAARRQDQTAEILLIGHSTGCQIATAVLAETVRQLRDTGVRPRFSFLTLGNNMTMLSWQPEASWFCKQISTVANQPAIDWIDFSIVSDGACFALHDPVAAAGVQRCDNSGNLKILNVRNFNLYSKASLDSMRFNKLLLHFQYMMAPETAGEYDFFRIVAGTKSLWERYKNQKSITNYEGVRLRIFKSNGPADNSNS